MTSKTKELRILLSYNQNLLCICIACSENQSLFLTEGICILDLTLDLLKNIYLEFESQLRKKVEKIFQKTTDLYKLKEYVFKYKTIYTIFSSFAFK